MQQNTKISMKIPMDFFDSTPVLKTELGSLKDLFSGVMGSSVFFVHIALIACIFIFMGVFV